MSKVQISQLNIYPVKSLKGISLNESEVTVEGLKYDRNWMIIDSENKFITQRQIPEMALISTEITNNFLLLKSEDGSETEVNLQNDKKSLIDTSVWNNDCRGYDEGNEVSKWLTNKLGKVKSENLRLIRFDKNFKRSVDEKYLKGEKSSTFFADGFPFLISSEESLKFLNDELAKIDYPEVLMDRFRANIVIKNNLPFDEFEKREISEMNDKYKFGLRKPCKRCKIITINQQNSEISDPQEPLAVLSKINPLTDKKGAYFGINSTLLKGENQSVKVGDYLNLI